MTAIAVGSLALLLVPAPSHPVRGRRLRQGLFRRDGTYVQPHTRSAPDSSCRVGAT